MSDLIKWNDEETEFFFLFTFSMLFFLRKEFNSQKKIFLLFLFFAVVEFFPLDVEWEKKEVKKLQMIYSNLSSLCYFSSSFARYWAHPRKQKKINKKNCSLRFFSAVSSEYTKPNMKEVVEDNVVTN